ncbi:MAG: VOC family protein [Proteobacteria bacterium]|nr:VOC family protein [Pseudomonadota bacterium]
MSLDLHIHHISIAVRDLDEAIEWYGRVLGFGEARRFRIEALNADLAFVRRGNLRLELWHLASAEPIPPERLEPNTDLLKGGTKHFGFTATNLGECLKRFVEQGVDIAAVQRSPAEPMRADADPLHSDPRPPFAMFIRDPGGTLIEVLDAEAVRGVLPD